MKGKTCRAIILAGHLRPQARAAAIRAARNGKGAGPPVFLTSFESSPMIYAASPIFFLMGFVTYFQAPAMCTVPGDFGFLSTMWLMYVIMGAVHASPWLLLARNWMKAAWRKECEPRRPS